MNKGIDISAYQKNIDFNRVKKHGISFVFIKATEGTGNFNLKQDIEQAKGAKAAGLSIGFYHFAKGNDAKTEADTFIRFVRAIEKEVGKADFPLALDIEDTNNIVFKGAAFDKWVLSFENRLKEHGYKMWIYSYAPYLNNRSNGGLTHIPLWIASYPAVFNPAIKPKLPKGWNSFVCWQYSVTDSVDGINGRVDLNVIL
jgi:N-acetylmuramoyl-L-alanine amidase|nr:MAG TPA: hypothetical protein [Caudoviricetes sp.]